MGAPRRVSLSDLGRPILMLDVRVEVPPQSGEPSRTWSGARAEVDADSYLRTLPRVGPAGAWAWMVRIHMTLEDRTTVTAHVPLRVGTPAPTIRGAAAAGLRRAAADLAVHPERRGEARRVLELLTGEPFRYEAAPDFRKMYQECLRVVDRTPQRQDRAKPPGDAA